jgi:hypothetical protein
MPILHQKVFVPGYPFGQSAEEKEEKKPEQLLEHRINQPTKPNPRDTDNSSY